MQILFEDAAIILVNKPAGVATLVGDRASVQDELLEKYPAQKALEDSGIVHRLDNGTSGILLIAKSEEYYKALRDMFAKGKITKRYLALVLGSTPSEGIITEPITHKNDKKMSVDAKGQEAHTHYERLRVCGYGRYSLLEVTIKTGVRHQIRVHLAFAGYPLAGDELYQKKVHKERDRTGLARPFLHSSYISFAHPATGDNFEWQLKLPRDLDKVLGQM